MHPYVNLSHICHMKKIYEWFAWSWIVFLICFNDASFSILQTLSVICLEQHHNHWVCFLVVLSKVLVFLLSLYLFIVYTYASHIINSRNSYRTLVLVPVVVALVLVDRFSWFSRTSFKKTFWFLVVRLLFEKTHGGVPDAGIRNSRCKIVRSCGICLGILMVLIVLLVRSCLMYSWIVA